LRVLAEEYIIIPREQYTTERDRLHCRKHLVAVGTNTKFCSIRSFLKAVRQLFLGPTQVGAAPQGGAMQAIARRNKNNRDGAVAEQTSPLEGG